MPRAGEGASLAGWCRRGLAGVAELLFPLPAGCPLCRAAGARTVCPRCRAALLGGGPACRKCGRPQPGPGGLCRACWQRYPPFGRARAVGVYAGSLRDALLRLKAGGEGWLADALGAVMAERLVGEFFPPDAVVPVPAHPRKRRQRGFNHAELLAAAVCRRLGLTLAPRALARSPASRPQAGLRGPARVANAAGAFRATGRLAARGKRILLVDDIYTTGATASACAEALLAQGARAVDVLVAAVSLLE